jgi:hypothetical protein
LILWPRATTHASLPFASGSFESIRGTVAVDWAAAAQSFSLQATVPANAVAEVRLPIPAGVAASSLRVTDGVAPPAACVADAPENTAVHFQCPPGASVVNVSFASFGTPSGSCATGFSAGACSAATSASVVRAACVGQNACDIQVSDAAFGVDPCNGVLKRFSGQVVCSGDSSGVVFANGSYVPGVPGISGAWINATTATLSVATGSGLYNFVMTWGA